MSQYTIVIHGGAGTLLRAHMSPEKEQAYLKALQEALDKGYEVLANNGSALDAVEAAVMCMEDSPLFNAGRGSVFTAKGTHEMDASIMDGKDKQAGAVTLVQGIRNPISLARKVMEQSEHVMLAGEGAIEFAKDQGLTFEDESYFHDEFRLAQWKKVQGTDETALDHDIKIDHKFGTVGAVALDSQGHVAAATSTGGVTNKRYGRVGDSPIIGSGTYASDKTCAVSCTGSGEFFIRGVVAYEVSALMEFKGLSLQEACTQVIHERLPEINGDGGLIAVDAQGNHAMVFNTEGMYRGVKNSQGLEELGIYLD